MNWLKPILDENKKLVFDEDGNIYIYNIANKTTGYMEDTLENRATLNIPLENDEIGVDRNYSEDNLQTQLEESETGSGLDNCPKWSHDTILLLITLYESNLKAFQSSKKTNKSIWNGIAKSMTEHGHLFTGEQCDIKLRNLKKTYKRIKDNNKETGKGAISWPYFQRFDAIFGKSADISPVATASNTGGYLSTCTTPSASTNASEDSLDCNSRSSTPTGSTKRTRQQPSAEEPLWLKHFRQEAADRHVEKMAILKELVDVLKNN